MIEIVLTEAPQCDYADIPSCGGEPAAFWLVRPDGSLDPQGRLCRSCAPAGHELGYIEDAGYRLVRIVVGSP